MKRLFFVAAGLLFLVAAEAKAEVITDSARKQAIYARMIADLMKTPFECAYGPVLEATTEGNKRISIGLKKDGQWGKGASLYLHGDSALTVLTLNQGQQPVLVVSNYYRRSYMVERDLINEQFIAGDSVLTGYFTTTEDYNHITRVRFEYKTYIPVDTGTIIDPKSELRETGHDLVMDCTRP